MVPTGSQTVGERGHVIDSDESEQHTCTLATRLAMKTRNGDVADRPRGPWRHVRASTSFHGTSLLPESRRSRIKAAILRRRPA